MTSKDINPIKVPLLRLDYSESELNSLAAGFKDILKSGHLTMSKNVENFEKQFASWNHSAYALGTNSGTSSLEIPLRAIDVRNKVVICPSNTYMATPLAAIHAGAKVCFVDTDEQNMQLSLDSLKRILHNTPNVACLIIVHIAGIISEHIHEIVKLCTSYGVKVLEDAAHAHGAVFNGIRAGNFGFAGSFSFYPTKVMNTAEGGMMVTSDPSIYSSAISLREHGKLESGKNIHSALGYNWRFSEINALLGLNEIKNAELKMAQRRHIAAKYDELLTGVAGIKKLVMHPDLLSSYYKYVIFLENNLPRTHIKKLMKDSYGIECPGEVYSDPCHSQPVFQTYPEYVINTTEEDFKSTQHICDNHMCLPLYPGLTDHEINYVVDSLKLVIASL